MTTRMGFAGAMSTGVGVGCLAVDPRALAPRAGGCSGEWARTPGVHQVVRPDVALSASNSCGAGLPPSGPGPVTARSVAPRSLCAIRDV